MQSKWLLGGAAALILSVPAHAASDAPTGYTKCAQVGGACSMSGTHSVALGKSGSFVYANLSGNFTCSKSLFTGGSALADSAWCSIGPASSSASSAAQSSAAASSVAASSTAASSVAASSKASSTAASSVAASSKAASSSAASSTGNDGACVSACTDYIRQNVKAKPLTQARIDSEAGSLKSAFTAYLSASNSALAADKAALKAERAGLSSVPSARGSDKTGPDTMPLSETASYYAGSKALSIAREIVSFQIPSGGWAKNMVRTGVVRAKGQSWTGGGIDPNSSDPANWPYVGTIDNGATITELRYLGKVQAAQTGDRASIQASITKGLNYLLAAQTPNWGWPQVYPLNGDYHDAITLNDDAMLNVIKLLREIGTSANSDFAFIDTPLRNKCATAASNGTSWLLANQVFVNGKRTVWGQQHDVLTGAPTPARAYEMPSLTSQESAKVVSFLMSLPNPDATTREAVYAAADFFKASQINDKKWSSGVLSSVSGTNAWARYYDLSVYNPAASTVTARVRMLFGDFADRHGSASTVYGLIFGSTTSVSAERLTGYAQYNSTAQAMLTNFASWSSKNARP
ncbi:pectate lyase [Uliginosibacterium aquaticum]|uniref:Pectate lyase n=1 Tax=Uliginosibacterium aquaticum TaxID=2731212 RepID=A0ABX2IM68_9RHOO|nr:pectate lyase [Uliginosibacterium aquaticum]NSL55779.1 pectate lyase [Uliginosibacterium aquaticum]